MFKLNKIKFVSFVALLLCFASTIEGNCMFDFENQLNKPFLTQKFGSNEIIVTRNSPIELIENEQIEAYCGSGFKTIIFYDITYGQKNFEEAAQKLNFTCFSNKIYLNYINGGVRQKYLYNNKSPAIACKGATYSMFESKDKLLNCNNAMSYVLGAKTNIPIILAGLCYDLDKFNLKYVNYKLQDRSIVLNKTELYPVGTNINSVSEPIINIERLFHFPSSENVKADIALQSKSNFWLNIAEYDISSIIQTNTSFKSSMNDFFNIVWWHQLRIGNWNRFVELLEERVEFSNYIIYSGASGTVKIPKLNNCEELTYLKINYTGGIKTVPQFIWTYLESTDKKINEDFVVIAYNSPYYEYFPINSTMICNDMCHEIDWMEPMDNSRFISTLGILYCCRPAEIVGLLDGFPKTETKEIIAPTPCRPLTELLKAPLLI